MKKKIIIVLSVIAILFLALGSMFLIDKNRMVNNKPVIFSTWGYDYAPPVENPYIDANQEKKFVLEEYISEVKKHMEQSGEQETFNVSLTEDIYGKEVDEYKQALEIEEVLGTIIYDRKNFVTIIPMPDFLDNQTYYFKEDELVAYKEDFMGIGGSVTYYFKDDEIIFIDESKIEEEMVFEAEGAKDIIERSTNIYEKFLKAKNVTISVSEKEDLVIGLLDGWKYEISGDVTDEYNYVVEFYKSDENKKMLVVSYKRMFSVCGTGLETKELILEDGNTANVGFYDGNESWSFITFDISEDEIVALNEGLTLEEANEALQMFKTLKIIRMLPGNITVTERSFIATIIEEEPSYLIVEPNDGEIEKQQFKTRKILIANGESEDYVRDYIYGVGRKVIITYNPIIQADTNIISGAEIDVDGYDDFEITVVESEKAEKKKILNNREIDKLNSDYDLYYYGLNEVNVKVNNKEMTFETALREGYITLSGLLTKANRDGVEKDYYDDGGSVRFQYEDYTVIKCNTLDGNKDLYICPKETSINEVK